ncbi:MAG: c-type cytochrome, partial [Planctomycetota bacterium]
MPPRPSFHPGLPLLALASALALPSCRDAVADAPSAPPVVAALARHELAPRVRGLVLRDELGCVACHADAADAPPAPGPRGPDLASVAARVRPAYLAAFLAAPHEVEPGTPMPDLLHGLAARDRAEAAANLAAYLQSFGAAAATSDAAPPAADAAAVAEGRMLFHTIGCAACHAPRGADGRELPLPAATPLAPLAAKYTHAALTAFLLAPHEARPARRMPDLRLAPAEAHALAHFLLAGSSDAATTDRSPTAPDPARVATGRTDFAARGCVHCHPLADPLRAPSPAAKPLAALDPTRGCLSGRAGPWPHYALTDAQRADLAAALAAPSTPPAADEPLQRLLAGRDCTACHTRDDWAKLADARQPFFVSADLSLGEDGRLP